MTTTRNINDIKTREEISNALVAYCDSIGGFEAGRKYFGRLGYSSRQFSNWYNGLATPKGQALRIISDLTNLGSEFDASSYAGKIIVIDGAEEMITSIEPDPLYIVYTASNKSFKATRSELKKIVGRK